MIVLMRHAHAAGGKGRCIGRTDLQLSAKGEEQARLAAQALGEIDFSRLYCGTLLRAQNTMRPIAARFGAQPHVDPAWNEIDMGQWDGLPFQHIQERYPEAYAQRGKCFSDFRLPGGESFNDVAERALAVLAEAAKGDLPALVVTHAGVIRCVLCQVTGHPMNDLFHFKVNNTGCTVLVPTNHEYELVARDIQPDMVAGTLAGITSYS